MSIPGSCSRICHPKRPKSVGMPCVPGSKVASKMQKRGLWGWHHSKMQDASRVERLWLAMAVAQVWTAGVGCQAEVEHQQNHAGTSLPATHTASRRRKRPAGQPPQRRLSCVVRGRLGLVAALFKGEVLPCGRLLAQAWPKTVTAPRKLPSASALHQRERKREQKRRARARARTHNASVQKTST
jgi:hypothetical protein